MNLSKYKRIVFSLAVGGLLLVGLFLMPNEMSQIARADSGVLFVTTDGSGTACAQATPCSLVTALNQSTDGDTIYVATGTYTGTGAAVITVTQNITIYGNWDGSPTTGPVVRDPQAYPTTLDGEDQRRVVYISGDIAPTLDGFIVTGGKAPDGGGVYIYSASPIIQNNVITGNRTITSTYDDGRGGGIFVGGVSNAIIDQNRIISNTSGYGGGIYHYGSMTITITVNEIVDNVASYRGGGIMVERRPDIIQANVISGNTSASDGGGILIWAAAPRVEANRITGNSANYVGGGISIGNNATPILLNNLLISNTQDGLFVSSSSPMVVNNTIVGNELPNSGDGIHLSSNPGCTPPYCTTGNITNNIIVSYEVGIFGTGIITPVIDYNDVWGNTTADYSLPAGVVTGTHNISLDPLFTNSAVGDYHLQSGSPCVDAGDPAGVPPAPPTDIDGDTRPAGDRVDIGADEVPFSVFLPVVLKSYTP